MFTATPEKATVVGTVAIDVLHRHQGGDPLGIHRRRGNGGYRRVDFGLRPVRTISGRGSGAPSDLLVWISIGTTDGKVKPTSRGDHDLRVLTGPGTASQE